MMDAQKIRSLDAKINAFVQIPDEPLGGGEGPLSDLTFAVKSNICVDGLLATCASQTLANYVAPYDATVIERIKAAGASICGMANMDEFACGSSGESSFHGPTINPMAPDLIPGGSSSGPAAAVASGMVDAALGSDTGGSIRNPASHCGVVGFKPTYGMVSRYGLIDLAMSLDQIGPIAKDVSTCARVMDVIYGHDIRDSTSLDIMPQTFSDSLESDMDGVKLGYAMEFDELVKDKPIVKAVKSSIKRLESHGARIVDVSLPIMDLAIPTYYLNVYVEFFSATRKYDGRRYGKRIEDACGEEVLRRIMLGKYISQKELSQKYYRRALFARSKIMRELSGALKPVDALIGPVVPKLPHKAGTSIKDPRTLYAYDIFTTPANLAGLPAGCVPAGKKDGIPCGLHVIGKPCCDQSVLNIMNFAQKHGP